MDLYDQIEIVEEIIQELKEKKKSNFSDEITLGQRINKLEAVVDTLRNVASLSSILSKIVCEEGCSNFIRD